MKYQQGTISKFVQAVWNAIIAGRNAFRAVRNAIRALRNANFTQHGSTNVLATLKAIVAVIATLATTTIIAILAIIAIIAIHYTTIKGKTYLTLPVIIPKA